MSNSIANRPEMQEMLDRILACRSSWEMDTFCPPSTDSAARIFYYYYGGLFLSDCIPSEWRKALSYYLKGIITFTRSFGDLRHTGALELAACSASNILSHFSVRDTPDNCKDSLRSLSSFAYYGLSYSISYPELKTGNALMVRAEFIEKFGRLYNDMSPRFAMAIPTVFALADYLDATPLFLSDGNDRAAVTCRELAASRHVWLEDISVGGRDACDYTIEELAQIGRQRHLAVYRENGHMFEKGEYNDFDPAVILECVSGIR